MLYSFIPLQVITRCQTRLSYCAFYWTISLRTPRLAPDWQECGDKATAAFSYHVLADGRGCWITNPNNGPWEYWLWANHLTALFKRPAPKRRPFSSGDSWVEGAVRCFCGMNRFGVLKSDPWLRPAYSKPHIWPDVSEWHGCSSWKHDN